MKQEALDSWTFNEFGSPQQKLFLKFTSFIKLVLQKIEKQKAYYRKVQYLNENLPVK